MFLSISGHELPIAAPHLRRPESPPITPLLNPQNWNLKIPVSYSVFDFTTCHYHWCWVHHMMTFQGACGLMWGTAHGSYCSDCWWYYLCRYQPQLSHWISLFL